MKSRRKIIMCLAFVVVASPVLSFYGCSKTAPIWDTVEGGRLKVLVSFPPLYCFTKGVADNDAKVLSLLATTGPHDHRATADDAQVAAGADLFLVNGLQLDDFVTTVVNTSRNKKIKIVEVAKKAIPQDKLNRLGDHDHDHGKGDGAGHHHHGEWDPHAWLGTEQAILMVKEIAATLKEADAEHAADYDKRAAAYINKLQELQAYGKELLKGKKNRKIIATHDALGYFCKSFDLDLVDSIMPQPGIEAGGPELAKLVDICKKDKVRLIANEPQYKKDAAETLRKTLKQHGHDVAIVVIDPLETVDSRDQLDADYYFRVMRKNLENLKDKME